MVRGGGFGGGGQLFDLLGGIAAMPLDDLLRIAVGLLLMTLIIVQMRRVRPAQPRPAQRSTTCLLCGRKLGGASTYVDRYFPNWVACSDCYRRLTPAQQRQYQPED